MILSHCQLQLASNFDYRRAQSVLRSTDDFNSVGLIPRLILPLTSFPFFFLSPSRDARHTLHPSYFRKRLLNTGILIYTLLSLDVIRSLHTECRKTIKSI